jgi:4-hydroxy-tetrahydrodipicolinate reductase
MQSVQYIAERSTCRIVGAVDKDPAKIGCDVGDLAELPAPLGVKVAGDAAEVLRDLEADVVVLTTTSSLARIKAQILEIVSYGKNIVSSCEELMFPWITQPEIAREIDEAAKRENVSVLATGVNPGFLMDFLPLVLSGVCRNVRKVTVERIQNAASRRLPFQKKIGAGLTIDEFHARVQEGTLRHVGLTESIHLIASGLGWTLDKTEDILAPVVSEVGFATDELSIPPGHASGVSQVGRGYRKGEEVITLVFRATVGEPDSHERIVIEGAPPIDLFIRDGVNGDIATCAIMTNAIPVVAQAPPGLRTMADIRTISCTP